MIAIYITFVLKWLQVLRVEDKGKCLPMQSHASVFVCILYTSVHRRFINGVKRPSNIWQESLKLNLWSYQGLETKEYLHAFRTPCVPSQAAPVFFLPPDLPTLVVCGAAISSHLTKLRDLPRWNVSLSHHDRLAVGHNMSAKTIVNRKRPSTRQVFTQCTAEATIHYITCLLLTICCFFDKRKVHTMVHTELSEGSLAAHVVHDMFYNKNAPFFWCTSSTSIFWKTISFQISMFNLLRWNPRLAPNPLVLSDKALGNGSSSELTSKIHKSSGLQHLLQHFSQHEETFSSWFSNPCPLAAMIVGGRVSACYMAFNPAEKADEVTIKTWGSMEKS